MILSRYHIALAAASLFAVAARASDRVIEVIAGFVERCIDFIVSGFRMDAPHLANDGPAFLSGVAGVAIDPSLLERLRHEKGIPRLGAARNI
ncbi:MAG: hypothetical protein BGO58_07975 [Sphingopyxis sp. 65-8]|nr:hypothetical protein [Sphingopyxis terrae]OJW19348.1 MAG: hypothetical protein BGO58_07975 [Sphingopyxis sp. 65-8]